MSITRSSGDRGRAIGRQAAACSSKRSATTTLRARMTRALELARRRIKSRLLDRAAPCAQWLARLVATPWPWRWLLRRDRRCAANRSAIGLVVPFPGLASGEGGGRRLPARLDRNPGAGERASALPTPRFKGRITFSDVTFGYEPGPNVLCGLDLEIRAGETIAFLSDDGRSRSAITDLLMRECQPGGGQVRVDGQDVREIARGCLRRQIALVVQGDDCLGEGACDSLVCGKTEACEAEIVGAAIAANAHDFIRRLPRGYATSADECSPALSASERRRISIARAMLQNAPIVILDEPLAGLEAESEDAVRVAFLRLIERRTSIVFTHHLATALLADRILTLVGGRAIELAHEQLLPRASARIIPFPARGRR